MSDRSSASPIDSVFAASRIILHLQGQDKTSIIHELVGVLADDGCLENPVAAEDAVLARERMLSTGMENGIALPHAKTDAVGEIVAAIGLAPSGVDFDCADGEAARIIVLALSPANKPGPHIKFLATVSKALGQESTRERLLAAIDAEEALEILREAAG